MIVLSLLFAAAAPAPAVARPVIHHSRHRVSRQAGRRKIPIVTRLRVGGCGYTALGGCARGRSPYRLPLDEPLSPSGKSRALAQTGTRCALIGQTICTHPPRTILRVEQ
jgi:hypothetical protein